MADSNVPDLGREHRHPRGPRFQALLTAAAMVVLGAGITVAVLSSTGRDDTPAASTPPSGVPRCSSDDLSVTSGSDDVAITGDAVRVRLTLENDGALSCALRTAPMVSVVNPYVATAKQFRPAAGLPRPVVLTGGGQLVYDARMSSSGTCRKQPGENAADPQLVINTVEAFTAKLDPLIIGSRLSPAELTGRILPGRLGTTAR